MWNPQLYNYIRKNLKFFFQKQKNVSLIKADVKKVEEIKKKKILIMCYYVICYAD